VTLCGNGYWPCALQSADGAHTSWPGPGLPLQAIQYVQMPNGSIQAFLPALQSREDNAAAVSPQQSIAVSMYPASGPVVAAPTGSVTASPHGAAARPAVAPQPEQPQVQRVHAPGQLAVEPSWPQRHSVASPRGAEPTTSAQQTPVKAGPTSSLDVSTLFVDNLPADMTKRELAHIFRPFGGFKVCANGPSCPAAVATTALCRC
jgi:RNA recognition motif. (a.k.a. RRM, RBD, or RNP domain)